MSLEQVVLEGYHRSTLTICQWSGVNTVKDFSGNIIEFTCKSGFL
ncbi:hypothetical protein MC7420_5881 [Coleofasciculus chthonoplastes PCC 7420]|uniref:Uncharacterized protein n=1 Tax=Coleofasciculus chthonoplastes PCC 7420 TaxID=118168 RepID=B4VW28_9CYAN|nr:hypothetical protein MC7420_5881 [Coleofasciculus chthonoplastes PCC 7420]